MKVDLMRSRRARSMDTIELLLSPFSIVALCLLLIFLILFVPAMGKGPVEPVTISNILGAGNTGYPRGNTVWTVEFEEKPGVQFPVLHEGPLAVGSRWGLQRTVGGDLRLIVMEVVAVSENPEKN